MLCSPAVDLQGLRQSQISRGYVADNGVCRVAQLNFLYDLERI
jgi:hypothetical protein